MTAKCPECGTELLSGARFCHRCGWDIRLPSAGAASAAAPGRPAWKRRTMAWVAVVTLALLVALISLPGQAGAAVAPGDMAPGFDLPLVAGGQVALADLQGAPVVLNFWATWCVPCREEMPLLQDAFERHRDQGVTVLGVNLAESRVTVKAFQDRYQLSFPIALDGEGKVTDRYGIIPLPTTFFIGADGRVVSKVEGQLRPEQLETELQRLVKGTGAPPTPAPDRRPDDIRGAPASGGGRVLP